MRGKLDVLTGIILLLLVTAVSRAEPPRKIDNFTLSDSQNQAWSLAEAKEKFVVVVFLGTECPLARLYGPRMASLEATYGKRGVAFVAINSNSQDSLTEVATYARTAGIKFPMLKDVGNRVADQFHAQRTPEVFLLNAAREIIYHGRIDDQYGVGIVRDRPQRRDLAVALDEVLAGKSVRVAKTAPVGCHIGRVQTPGKDASVTYASHIAAILNKRCVECHRDGDIAPFSLTRADDVSGWAETIAEVVADGRMPPWHASEKYGKFAGDRRLSVEEKQLIKDWAAAGAPLGDLTATPEPPMFPEAGWQIAGEPDLVVPMADKPFVVKAEGEVRYQFFTVDPGLKEDVWLKGVEVLPGNHAVVHHCLVHARSPGVKTIDGVGGFLAGYVPGHRAQEFPQGMAKFLPAGSKLVFQLHYTSNGSQQTDTTRLGFWFAKADEITHEVSTVSAVRRNFEIPPGDPNFEVTASSVGAPPETLLLSFMPHMHLRGKSFRYELRQGEKSEILLDVPRYDFNWQTSYRLAKPLPLPPGSRVLATAHFDNSSDNPHNPDPAKAVRWGDQTDDEMMIGYFDIALPKDAPKGRLSGVGDGRMLRQLDANSDGRITRDEVPARFKALFDRLARGENSVSIQDLEKRMREAR